MSKRIKIKNIILKEVENTKHQLERFKSRFNVLCQGDIDNEDKMNILRNVNALNQTTLDDKSYAVRLGDFKVNKDSKYFVDVNGRGYYRVNDELFKDSTGNEFWAIVRNNKITTFMLRKDVQSRDANYMKDKLRIDDVIFDISSVNETIGENVVTEDFKSHTALTELVEDMFKNFLLQFIKKTYLLRQEPTNFTCNVFKGLTYKYGELNKFINEYALFLYFKNIQERGYFQGSSNHIMGSIFVNADPSILYQAFLDNYENSESHEELANDMYYKLRSDDLMTVMLHELQHAYDEYRSEGKYIKDKKSRNFYNKKRKGITPKDDANMSKQYNSLPHEVQARFTQTLSDTPYQKNGEMIPLKQYVINIRDNFHNWNMLEPKQHKTIYRKASQYYHKFKEEFEKKKGE